MLCRYAYAALTTVFLLTGCNDVPLDYADLRDLAGAEGLDTDTLDMAALALSLGETMAADDSTSAGGAPRAQTIRWTQLGGTARAFSSDTKDMFGSAIWRNLETGRVGERIVATSERGHLTGQTMEMVIHRDSRASLSGRLVRCREFLLEIGPTSGSRSVFSDKACRRTNTRGKPLWELSASNPSLISYFASRSVGEVLNIQ